MATHSPPSRSTSDSSGAASATSRSSSSPASPAVSNLPSGKSSAPGDTATTRDPEARARALCLDALAARPHTRAELATKLHRKQVPDELATRLLDRFTAAGLIDDSAYANAWVDSRHHNRGLARRALAHELRLRGVDQRVVEHAVARVSDTDEESAARDLVERRLRGMSRVPVEARARRLMGLLARRGYPGAMSASVVREALRGSGVTIPDPDHAGL